MLSPSESRGVAVTPVEYGPGRCVRERKSAYFLSEKREWNRGTAASYAEWYKRRFLISYCSLGGSIYVSL